MRNLRRGAYVAAVTIAGLGLAFASPAQGVAPARLLDRAVVQCPSGALLTVELERDRQQLEVDVELYAAPRERWSFTVVQQGGGRFTLTRALNREGETGFWRYLSDRPGVDRVTVTARSTASGAACVAQVRG